jgi:hypothetical protein
MSSIASASAFRRAMSDAPIASAARLENLARVLHRPRFHAHAEVRARFDPAFGIEPAQCFAHGRAAHAEAFGELFLAQILTRAVLAVRERVFDGDVDVIGRARRFWRDCMQSGLSLRHFGLVSGNRRDYCMQCWRVETWGFPAVSAYFLRFAM